MSFRKIVLCSAIVALLFSAGAYLADAQVDQGVIGGLVQDTSGAVIPDADVALTTRAPAWFSTRTVTRAGGLFFRQRRSVITNWKLPLKVSRRRYRRTSIWTFRAGLAFR